jgi:hypothetical protein
MNKILLCECDAIYKSYTYFWQEYIELIDISNFKKKFIECRSINRYIHIILDIIKDNFLRKFSNLNKLKINISKIEEHNIYHNFVLSVLNLMLFKNELFIDMNLDKLLFIMIWNGKKLVFITIINFNNCI